MEGAETMTYIPDLSEDGYIDSGPYVRAVGWLDDKHEFPTGKSPRRFVRKLDEIVKLADASKQALGWLYFLGIHTCEMCKNSHSAQEIGIPADELLYIAPAMIFHYVEEHQYLPPRQFIKAVLRSPLPGTTKYRTAVAYFREIYKEKEALAEAKSLESLMRIPGRE